MQQNSNQNQTQNQNYDNYGMQKNMEYAPKAHNPYVRKSQTSVTDLILGKTPTERFIRGAAIGALATYLLTNEKAQQSLAKGAVRVYEGLAGGAAEMKEKFMDAKAEYQSAKES